MYQYYSIKAERFEMDFGETPKSHSNHPAAEHLIVRGIPHRKLSRRNPSLRLVEKHIHSLLPHHERRLLQRLPVANPHPVSSDFPRRHPQVFPNPVQFFCRNPKTAT